MTTAVNILAGVDLSRGDRLVSPKLTVESQAAVDQAIALAVGNKARLTLHTVLDLPPNTLGYLEEDPESLKALEDLADSVLKGLAETARQRGVTDVQTIHTFGKSWLELTRQVLKGQHDLLMIGTRNLSGMERMVLGSTGLKLFRNCPCPVWITKPHPEHKVPQILVATDLAPGVAERLTELGAQVTRALHGEMDILHALEYPWDNSSEVPHPKQDAYREKVKAHAQTRIQQLLSLPEVAATGTTQAKVILKEELAEDAILDTIKELDPDVLVMATIAHSGLLGLLVGNTAERLMTKIPCSVLAIKPADFKCPVSAE